MNRLNPLNDIVFIKCFGEKGCEPQLISLLNAILKRTGRNNITHVEIIPHKALTPETITGKSGVLDVHAKTADNKKFIVEIQRKNEYNMDRRTLFYWAREFIRGINSGQDYSELPDVVAINILDYEYLKCEDFHTSFHLYEDEKKDLCLTGGAEIHLIELPKFRKLKKKDLEGNALHRWLTFLDPGTPETAVEEIMLSDPVIEKAKTMMNEIEADDALYHAYTLYQLTLMHEKDLERGAEIRRQEAEVTGRQEGLRKGLQEGRQEGLQEGRQEGLQEGRQEGQQEGEYNKAREISRNLKAIAMPIDKIASVTGLTPEEIEKL